jgi:hypothetical protein
LLYIEASGGASVSANEIWRCNVRLDVMRRYRERLYETRVGLMYLSARLEICLDGG